MPEVDPIARTACSATHARGAWRFRNATRSLGVVALSAWVVASLPGCSHAAPCHGTAWCAGGTVCGLAGTCVPPPSADEARFVRVREVGPRDVRLDGAPTDADRWVLGGGDGPVLELDFGPLPGGELRQAILRIFPYPGAGTFDGQAVVSVQRGRRDAAVRYSIGGASPVLLDVTELLEGLAADEVATLAVRTRSEARFFAASDRIADATIRPTLTLVQR